MVLHPTELLGIGYDVRRIDSQFTWQAGDDFFTPVADDINHSQNLTLDGQSFLDFVLQDLAPIVRLERTIFDPLLLLLS